MKICIDASALVLDKASGLKSYTYTLISELLNIDKENEYLFFYNYFLNRNKQNIPLWDGKNIENVLCRIPRRILLNFLYKNFNFPKIELFTGKIDIFHSLHTYIPPTKFAKTILTVHDLREFYFPEEYEKEKGDAILRINSLKRTDFIITISESTKKDIIKFLNFPEEKIHIVYNDLDERFSVSPDKDKINKILEKYNIKKEFLLYVGNLEIRKNIEGLIKAFSKFITKYKTEHILVIAGGISKNGSKIEKIIEEENLKERIIFIPYIENLDLVCLYNACSCFLFLSLYEGFGLPPLEAMACGAPVIASNTSSIPEVVGDAGILVDPKNIEEIADSIYRVISDKQLRDNLIQNGLERAEIFKQKNMAKKTLEIYKKIYNE